MVRRQQRRRPQYFRPAASEPAGARGRVENIVRELDRVDPAARTRLQHRSPFELLVATILSARCTDSTVNRITPALFARYPSPQTLSEAKLAEVEELIRSTGFFRSKARAIVESARELRERFAGHVPRRMDDLIMLPGVERKTANVVLSSYWPRPISDHGIAVDTHVHRVSQRLGLTAHDDADRIEDDLMRLVPEGCWARFPFQLMNLGRNWCRARSPDHSSCPLLVSCPTGLREV